MDNHVDWAKCERDKMPDKKDYYTEEEAVEESFKAVKDNKKIADRRIRVWKHRWRNGKLGKKTIKFLLVEGGFQKALTWYKKCNDNEII